jgi:hypothetical protein
LTLPGVVPRLTLTTAGAFAACVVAASTVVACGSASHRDSVQGRRAQVPAVGAVAQSAIPAALVAEARPIGSGPRFQPSVSGPVMGACRRSLGPRYGAHIEVFAADRVVLLPAGIGAAGPFRRTEGRISSARCFGQVTTLEPTGVALVRPGSRVTIADLFRSWGQPLSDRRLASFTPPGETRVTAFVDGRRWPARPGAIRLRRHQEIVLEVGPHVPPHATYRFPPGF